MKGVFVKQLLFSYAVALTALLLSKYPLTVQRLLVISLLFLHFFGNTEMGQIISVPQIFQHYQYHQLQPGNKDLSFAGFINMHYLGNDGDMADDDQDAELPFLHYIHPLSLVAVSPPAAFSVLFGFHQAGSIELGCYTNQHSLNDFSSGLLRPPRFVS